MMTMEQMQTIKDFADMLTKQIEKINKKGDISPDELQRMDKAVDIIKDISVICAMEEYGSDPEEEMYSSMGYYGRNSRAGGGGGGGSSQAMYGGSSRAMYGGGYSGARDSMGRYSSRGYSRDDGVHQMREDLEMKLANATDERERQAIMKCLRALDS